MGERILIGIDGQSSSERALEWAVERARNEDGELQIVTVADVPDPPVGTTEHTRRLLEAAEGIVERAVAHVRELAPDVRVTSQVERGHVVEAIERLSESVDLVVVGTNYVSRLQNLVRGTRSIKIAATSARPVVVVPDIDLGGRSGVVVGVDGSDASEHAITFAAAEAARTGDDLVAVYAWSTPVLYSHDYVAPPELHDAFVAVAAETLSISLAGVASTHPDLRVEHRVVEGDATSALAAAGRDARLIVVGHRGRGPVKRLLLGSVSHGVLLGADAPVAIVR